MAWPATWTACWSAPELPPLELAQAKVEAVGSVVWLEALADRLSSR